MKWAILFWLENMVFESLICTGHGSSNISKVKGETTYSIRMLPLGGFCKMEGEDEESQGERNFGDKESLATTDDYIGRTSDELYC